MNLTKLEIAKILKNKFVWIFILLFVVLDIYNISKDFKSYGRMQNDFNKAYYKVYDQVSGRMTDEKISFVVSEYKRTKSIVDSGNFSTEPNQPGTYTGYIYGDMGMFYELFERMDYAYNYKDRLSKVLDKAKNNVNFFSEKNNIFEVRNNTKIIETYDNRKIDTFYDTDGFKFLINYDFSSLLIIFMIILGLVPVFSGEKFCRMNIIIKTTNIGKRKIIKTKLFSAYIYTFFISLLFLATDIITYAVLFGFDGANNCIYSIDEFIFSPLTIKIWQYLLLAYFIKLICFFVLTSIILLCSTLFSENIFPFVTSAFIIISLLFVNDFIDGKIGQIISIFNPLSLLSTRILFNEYNVVNFMNYPVYKVIPILIVSIILLLCLNILIVVINSISTRVDNSYYAKITNKIKELLGTQ